MKEEVDDERESVCHKNFLNTYQCKKGKEVKGDWDKVGGKVSIV